MSNLPPGVTDAMIESIFGDPICVCGHNYSDHEEGTDKCLACDCEEFREYQGEDEPVYDKEDLD